MPTSIQVKYYNSFWIKKVKSNQTTSRPVWPGLPWDPTGYPTFPGGAKTTGATENWLLEESRIKGGYNNVSVSLGAKAYLNEEDPVQVNRKAGLIFSGIFNSRTGLNETNVFSLASPITKELNPDSGSIQKLFAEDTNVITFQERKVGYVLINKNTIYTGDQGATETTGIPVLGQYVPYAGEYGISEDPESFAYFGNRKYFTDKDRGVVLRLSRDGLTEISTYGMKDYFRDNLPLMSNNFQTFNVSWTLTAGQSLEDAYVSSFKVDVNSTIGDCKVFKGSIFRILNSGVLETSARVTNIVDESTANEITITLDQSVQTSLLSGGGDFVFYYKGKIQGGYDNYNRVYTLSLQNTPDYISSTDGYSTVTFDESVRGWVSFYTYKPNFIYSISGKFYSITGNNIYEHYSGTSYMNFYGSQGVASVAFVFNDQPSLVKNFKTINYEGDNGWFVDVMTSGNTQFNKDYPESTSNTFNTVNKDTTLRVFSYEEGLYTDPLTGEPKRAGFDRKENKYVANLVNDSVAMAGEVRFGNVMTGIKGFFAKVTFSTDSTTDPSGLKEIWSLGSEVVRSS